MLEINLPSDMHYSHAANIQAKLEINGPSKCPVTVKRSYLHKRWTDTRTGGQTDGQTSRTITKGSFAEEKKLLNIRCPIRYNVGVSFPGLFFAQLCQLNVMPNVMFFV